VSLSGHDGSNSASVTSSGDHAKVAGVKLDGVLDLASGDVNLDTVVDLDDGVRVSDGSAIGGVQVGDSVGASLDLPDLAQLILGLLGGDPVNGESSLHVVDDTEVLSGLFNLDNIHESSRELGISPGLAINLDQPLLEDGLHLLGAQGILQTIPKSQFSFIPDILPSVNFTFADGGYVVSFTDPLKKERSIKARYPLRKGLYLVTNISIENFHSSLQKGPSYGKCYLEKGLKHLN